MDQTAQVDPIKDRILDEAEKLFADKGFDAVSVREITTAADAHLSAVNYHFDSKHNLYLEVFRQRCLPRAKRILAYLDTLDHQDQPSLEQIVRSLAQAFIQGFDNDEERLRHHQLIHHEISNPSEALQIIIDGATGPIFRRLIKMMKPHIQSDLTIQQGMLCLFSVFSQVLVFSFSRHMVSGLTGREYDEQFREELVEHITRFSLLGLTGMCQGGAK